MKHFIFTFLWISFVFTAFAQKKDTANVILSRHEIGLAYGMPNSSGLEASVILAEGVLQLANDLSNIFGGNPDYTPYKIMHQSTGIPLLYYRYSKSKKWSFSGTIAYNNIKYQRLALDGTAKILNKTDVSSIFVMAGAEFHYLKKATLFDLYSGVQLGYRFNKSSSVDFGKPIFSRNLPFENLVITPYHINLLGCRFGKKLGGFVDIGIGMRSVLNAGISYRP